MEEQLISFETAKLAKEKGFNGYCYGMESLYLILEDFWAEDYDYLMYKKGEIISSRNVPIHLELKFELIGKRPTQSLLQKWIRDIHNIHISINSLGQCNYHLLVGFVGNILTKGNNYSTYEEALEKGLQEALNLIPDKI